SQGYFTRVIANDFCRIKTSSRNITSITCFCRNDCFTKWNRINGITLRKFNDYNEIDGRGTRVIDTRTCFQSRAALVRKQINTVEINKHESYMNHKKALNLQTVIRFSALFYNPSTNPKYNIFSSLF